MSDSPLFSDIASYSSITSKDRENYLEELSFDSPKSERSELLDDFLERLETMESNTEDSLPTLETNLPLSDTFSPKKTSRKKTSRKKTSRKRTSSKKQSRKKTSRKKTSRKRISSKKQSRKKNTSKKNSPKQLSI